MAALLLLGACGSDERALAGAHVTVHLEGNGTVCGGTVPYLDEAYGLLSDYMRVPEGRRRPVDYYFSAEASICGEDALGCAADDGRRVWARSVDLVHELAHALQHRASGDELHVFLAEGLAGALEQPSGRLITAGDYERFDEALAWTLDKVKRRDIAGDFVSYLLHVHGFERFARLFTRAPRGSSVSALTNALEDVYGKPITALVQERLASGLYFPEARLGVSECWTEPLAAQAEGWSFRVSLRCADAGVIGPVTLKPERQEWENIRYAAVEVADAGTHAVWIGPGAFSVDVAEPCAPTAYPVLERHRLNSAPSGTTLAVVDLARGRHAFRLAAPSAGANGGDSVEDPEDLQVDVRMMRMASAVDCTSGSVSIPPDVARLVLLGRPGQAALAVAFSIREARVAELTWYGVIGAEICKGACGEGACQAFNTLGSPEPELELAAGSYRLRFQYANLPRGLAALTFQTP
ncbi:MAG TPA: hypothetical protein VK524_02980 [Polyangiaceae bacterium]|nr:hypothetical protein [Polyangiaceae bacterium]